jgi:GNAT superfamily N-acetyltransferase
MCHDFIKELKVDFIQLVLTMTPSGIRIRNATAMDEPFIATLVARLTEFGVPPWRDPQEMHATDREVLIHKLHHPSADIAIFVAEVMNGTPFGFIHVHEGTDHYYKEPHGHISDLIIAPSGEGLGIAKLLVSQAEEWCSQKGFRWLTLSVFCQNARARAVYGHLGFGDDILKCVKVLDRSEQQRE